MLKICRRLGVEDLRFVEIESKRRVLPEDAKEIRKFLLQRKGLSHQKSALFFDQFLDTPSMELLKRGVSLRLRYKRNGSHVYLQYKGPGFHYQNLLFRSEFSTARLRRILLEESHRDIVHFAKTSIRDILLREMPEPMAAAMKLHLGPRILGRIDSGPVISIYQKEKFKLDLGRGAFLEPSLDRIFAFHISRKGLHPLSSFCEYENEIKSKEESVLVKLKYIPELMKFDRKLSERFHLRPEKLDKYHRCASFFR